MRSSDWSSDVCSSDLQQVALNALARDVGAAALGARGDLVDLVQEDDAVLLDSGDRGADYRLLVEQLVALLGDQIGRASCRERVCQYVSISVVAVSITKTDQKHNNNQHTTKTTD